MIGQESSSGSPVSYTNVRVILLRTPGSSADTQPSSSISTSIAKGELIKNAGV